MSKLVGVAPLVLVGAIISGCAAPAPAPTQAPSPTPTRAPSADASIATSPDASGALAVVSLEARDLSFAPNHLEAVAGQPFELSMHDAGVITHNVTIDAPVSIQLVVGPGRTGSTMVEALAPGTYTFYCSVSGHRRAGMEGTLTIR